MLPLVDETRQAYSERRLDQFVSALGPLDELQEHRVCVYATGSYGRLEAWSESDVDVFFLSDPPTTDVPFTVFVRLAAKLIEVAEQQGFPPFSGDGKYLEIRSVSEMESVLGSPSDDSTNAFTARMLLLLESRPIHGSALYDELLRKIVGFYYRDFSDHGTNFTPSFPLNDILRFWRTLTLNYEHDRLKLFMSTGLNTPTGPALVDQKAKSALKNYKLKVSRLSTCFSMVANLSAEPKPVELDAVLELCGLTPAERFDRLGDRSARASALVREPQQTYEEFLECTQRPRSTVLDEFRDEKRRAGHLKQARHFGDLIYDLLDEVVDNDRFRYLVV